MSSPSSRLRARWSKLAKRERLVVGIGASLLILGLLDLAVVEPLLKSGKSQSGVVAAKKVELAQAVRQRQDLTAELDARRRDSAAGAKAVAASFFNLFDQGVLWRSDAADAWFKSVVEKHGRSLSLVSIATQGVSDPQYPGLYAHAVGFAGEMQWTELDGFIAQLSLLPAFRLDDLLISAIDEPGRGVEISVKVNVLSDEKIWRAGKVWTSPKGGA